MAPERYTVGQLWEATDNWLVIGKIDTFDAVTVISVSAFKDKEMASRAAAHLPFSLATFERSIRKMHGTGNAVADSFEDGYHMWRDAFDAGKAGVW